MKNRAPGVAAEGRKDFDYQNTIEPDPTAPRPKAQSAMSPGAAGLKSWAALAGIPSCVGCGYPFAPETAAQALCDRCMAHAIPRCHIQAAADLLRQRKQDEPIVEGLV